VTAELPICRRYGRAVDRNRDRYDVFEQMHWSCFHYEFEHGSMSSSPDPDIACADPGCPARAFDTAAPPSFLDGLEPKRPDRSAG
jgi:hypothetical protein